ERRLELRRGGRLDVRRDRQVDRAGAAPQAFANAGGRGPQRLHGRIGAEARLEQPDGRTPPQLVDRRNGSQVGHRGRAAAQSAILCHHAMPSDPPRFRPLERFWPYADLPEQPTDAELAALDPDLFEALFGAQARPFSITLVFPQMATPDFPRALEMARHADEFQETGSGDALRFRARFHPASAAKLRDLFQLVGGDDATEVLIDDRPVPFARELWLPLVWFLIPR
ncbi:MAG TPA: hypothetical protein VFO24_03575, partial [Usitatibacter sp.]|nr:hypothetical protein [Usitatibacter sp.]